MRLMNMFVIAPLSVMAVGCGTPGSDGSEAEPLSQLTAPLTATAPTESVYRLNQGSVAIFDNSGQRVATLQPDPNQPIVIAELKPGTYFAELEAGWVLQRQVDNGWVDVVGTLTAKPIGDFSIHPGETTQLLFGFDAGFTTGTVTATSPEVIIIDPVPGETGFALAKIEVDDCGLYVSKISSLASFTVACLGTIDDTLYSVSGGTLVRNFSSCTTGNTSALASIDGVLSLQYDRPELEAAHPKAARDVKLNKAYSSQCIAKTWEKWQTAFDPTTVNVCPDWQLVSVQNPPQTGVTAVIEAGLPPYQRDKKNKIDYVPPTPPSIVGMQKQGYTYQVSFPAGSPPANCGSAANCAVACAAGFNGFVVSTDGVDQVVADPNYWEEDTQYAQPDNPYLKSGYYHAMADYGPIPGDQFGHFQRSQALRDRKLNWVGEQCSYYLDGIRFYTRLKYDSSRTGAVSWCTPDL